MFARASGRGKLVDDKTRGPGAGTPAACVALYLSPLRVLLVQKGMGKARRDFFAGNVENHGGVALTEFGSNVTHVVVDESLSYDALCGLLKVAELKPPVVYSKWLSECFKQGCLVPCDEYVCPRNPVSERSGNRAVALCDASPEKKPRIASDPTCSNSQRSPSEAHPEAEASSPEKSLKSRWRCSEPSTNDSRPNYNSNITTILQKMVDAYESTADKWRAFGYQKAINALKNCQKEIRTYEEALALPGVGKRLAEKIWEIIDSGELRKLEHFENDEEVKAAQLFSGIWGVGPETARIWVQQGLRTLDDVRTKAKLTGNQKVGLAHYDDFAERMPREEAAAIVETVVGAVMEFGSGFVAEGCGSYRRGKQTCGDVDVLVTHPDGHSHEGLLPKLLAKLHDTGFLTSDLSVHESQLSHQKYMGVCRLPGADNKFRRIDVLITHHRHFACALMHFTGSALFNRSMRSLAISKGMLLTEYALNADVVRKDDNERLHDGRQLPTPTEQSIFDYLGIPYRKPEERDW